MTPRSFYRPPIVVSFPKGPSPFAEEPHRTEHWRFLREMLGRDPAGPVPEAVQRERRAFLAAITGTTEAEWDPAKHPRLGGPPNAGWFAANDGAGGSGETSKRDRTGILAKDREPDSVTPPANLNNQLKKKTYPDIETEGSRAGTPRQPIGDGLAISIFGQEDNPNYKDYSSDPEFDAYRKRDGAIVTRPNTSTLKDKSVSDISIRGAPINKNSWKEIVRISKPGATVTIAGPIEHIEKLYKEIENGDIIDGFQYWPRITPYKSGGVIDAGAFQIQITDKAKVVE